MLDSKEPTKLNVCMQLRIFVQLNVVIKGVGLDGKNFKVGLKNL
jgi:hypothetical protein